MKEIAPGIALDESGRLGNPVVKGTRVAVTKVLAHLAAGDPPKDVAEQYGISSEDVVGCLAFALHLLLQGHLGGSD